MKKLFAGIDLGTSGCRLMIIDEGKNLHYSDSLSYSNPDEQSPELWWQSVQALLKNLSSEIKSNLQSIAIDGTSGTVLLVNDNGNPISSALMYNDLRATEQAKEIKSVLPSDNGGQGASGSLARVLWLLEYEINNSQEYQEEQGQSSFTKVPKTGGVANYRYKSGKNRGGDKLHLQNAQKQGGWQNNSHITHQADYILGKLSNNYRLSDENNCLKLGYDVVKQCWPNELTTLGIPPSLLPKVYPAGTAVAVITAEQANALGLNKNLKLVTGTTDSIAAFIATGADKVGDAVTSLGSTLVLKLICDKPLFSSEYGIYSHRLQDKWLVGGASNSGAKVLQHYFTQSQIDEMTVQLSPDKTTELNYYPLINKGERFPIADSNKSGRLSPRPKSDQEFFQGILEGIAKIEAQGYQKLIELGVANVTSVRSVGGGSKNIAWTKIRKNTLRKNNMKVDMITPKQTEAAYGSALLAMKGYDKHD